RAADAVALVGAETQPGERVGDALSAVLDVPLDVGVLDAQDESAAVAARMEIAEQRGTRGTDVEPAGRRGREPGADRPDGFTGPNMEIRSSWKSRTAPIRPDGGCGSRWSHRPGTSSLPTATAAS